MTFICNSCNHKPEPKALFPQAQKPLNGGHAMTWTQVGMVDWRCNECGTRYTWDEEPRQCEACERHGTTVSLLYKILLEMEKEITKQRNQIPLPFKTVNRLRRLKAYYEMSLVHHERQATEKNHTNEATRKLIDEYEKVAGPVMTSNLTAEDLIGFCD